MLTRKEFLKLGLVMTSPVWAPRSMGDEGVAWLSPPSRVTSVPAKLYDTLIPYSDKGFFVWCDLREKFEGPLPNISLLPAGRKPGLRD